jgi:hypothetical protein
MLQGLHRPRTIQEFRLKSTMKEHQGPKLGLVLQALVQWLYPSTGSGDSAGFKFMHWLLTL